MLAHSGSAAVDKSTSAKGSAAVDKSASAKGSAAVDKSTSAKGGDESPHSRARSDERAYEDLRARRIAGDGPSKLEFD
jgi:hypothetical protein